ncbi:MAG TPA: hypothetical protein VM261_19795 [Kofleriaceae bacterium]|nr:hypothetical protein [Kofleriaceae bacterium]
MSVEAGRRAATYRLVERSVGAYARIDAMVDTARHAARLFADGLLGRRSTPTKRVSQRLAPERRASAG